MKRKSLDFVILKQLAFIAACVFVSHVTLKYYTVITREYALSDPAIQAAPRMLVKGQISHGTVSVSTAPVYHLEDTPLLGKSLWWGSDWQAFVTHFAEDESIRIEGESYENRVPSAEALDPLPLRPHPGNEVKGARRIPVEGELPVAVFWTQGEDSLWSICRVEAAGSSEDTLREGERRIPGKIKTFKSGYSLTAKRQGDRFAPLADISLYLSPKESCADYPFISYNTSAPERMALKGIYDAEVIMELALPENAPIAVTEVYINKHPLSQLAK